MKAKRNREPIERKIARACSKNRKAMMPFYKHIPLRRVKRLIMFINQNFDYET